MLNQEIEVNVNKKNKYEFDRICWSNHFNFIPVRFN